MKAVGEMGRLRVAHIKTPFLGYSETFIHNYIRHLTGFEPVVVTEYTINEERYPVREIVRLRRHAGWFERPLAFTRLYVAKYVQREILMARPYARALRVSGAALMHVHFGAPGLMLLDVKRRVGLPMVVSFYGYDLSQLPRAMGHDIYRRNGLFERGEAFTVEGTFARRCLLDLGCPPEKAHILHVGVDLEQFAFVPRRLQGGERPRLFFCGRLVPKKGLLPALQALAEVRRAGYDFELRVAGAGPDEGAVRSLVRELELSDRVTFLGIVTHQEFLRECQRNHVLLAPSRTDPRSGETEGGSPTVILEAQATGMPVVSTRHADIPEAAPDGVGAFLAAEGDVEDLARCVKRALEEAERWPEMGRAGRAHIEASYDIRNAVRQLEDLYERLLSEQDVARREVREESSRPTDRGTWPYVVLLRSGAVARARNRNRRYARIILYHSVAPEESPYTRGLGVTVKPATFAKQLDYLCRHYEVVSLAELVERLARGTLGERVVVITFDDGFADTYRTALPMLRERGLPATMFLVADAIDNKSVLWMHRLAYLGNTCGAECVLRAAGSALGETLVQGLGPDAAVRNLRERMTCRMAPLARDRLLDRLCDALRVSPEEAPQRAGLYLSRDEIASMRAQGIAFGCHGATHTAFAVLSEAEQEEELRQSREAVAPWADGSAFPLAYPFGESRHYTEMARRLALDLGYDSLLAAGGGWVGPESEVTALDRIKVEEEPLAAFAARLEGVSLRTSTVGLLRGWRP
ncbi:MAG: glycosyltransferase [Gemmatimonadetes bacterium]|nr:glycosyltransferase [Gemmatimonadota bacterium]